MMFFWEIVAFPQRYNNGVVKRKQRSFYERGDKWYALGESNPSSQNENLVS
jgi:hypothetical protein